MGQGVGGGAAEEGLKIESEKIATLVVNDVSVNKKVLTVEVPKYVNKEQIKYVNKEQKQVKYSTVEEDTTKYNVAEKSTVKYVPKEEETIKFIPKYVETEKQIIKEKVLVVTTIKDLDALKAMAELVPGLVKTIEALTEKLNTMKDYKLVEEIIKVPKNKYIPIEVERITWKDVPHERCNKCGKEV